MFLFFIYDLLYKLPLKIKIWICGVPWRFVSTIYLAFNFYTLFDSIIILVFFCSIKAATWYALTQSEFSRSNTPIHILWYDSNGWLGREEGWSEAVGPGGSLLCLPGLVSNRYLLLRLVLVLCLNGNILVRNTWM